MFNKTIFSLLAILLLGVMSFAKVVLQNGLDGYEGCTDTHFRSLGDGDTQAFEYIDLNFHDEITIMTAN